jgi:NAD(P)-dependent dehydrogenase (short-subunit alcohol dehydrogenase family)
MDLQLDGKRVLVSGGTRGIGRAIVEGFLDEGAAVGFCARNADEVTRTIRDLEDRGTVLGTVADIGDDDAVAGWVAQSAERLGGIDIVVANVSALAIPDTDENWAASLNVDVMGTVRLVRSAMPYLQHSDAAAIVAISSVTGREADFASGPYGTAKTAIVGYIQGLAFHLAGQNIRANTVSPGNTFFPGGVWDSIKQNNRDLYDSALALNPTGRMGTPQEMANAVVFLSSPRASFISGTNLVADGALTRGIQL